MPIPRNNTPLGKLVTVLVGLGLFASTLVFAATTDFLSEPSTEEPFNIAIDYLRSNTSALGVSHSDLADFAISDQYVSQHNGVTHIYLRQRHEGIEVMGAVININISHDGRVINVGNRFLDNLAGRVRPGEAILSPVEAVDNAASSLGLAPPMGIEVLQSTLSPAQESLMSGGNVSEQDIPARLVYLGDGRDVVLAWELLIDRRAEYHLWQIFVNAATGAVHPAQDLVIHEDFIQQYTDAHGVAPERSSTARAGQPPLSHRSFGPPINNYRVYHVPVESPNHAVPAPPADGRTTEVDPAADASANGSPFGWHNDGTTAFTDTRGNNVDANKGTLRFDCGATLDCTPGIDLTIDPTIQPNVDAALVNLFDWNNLMHDIWYNYGFDEASGNFQEHNNGMGGAGGDSVDANAQAPGNCNANFGTPADGSNPTMNMFVCNIATPSRDGDFDNGVIAHEYGHGVSNRLTGGPGNVSCLNNSEQAGEGWSDFLGIVMTIEPGDAGTDPRGVGTWLLGTGPDGPGVRQFRYSTDMGENPHTYGDLPGVVVPHGVGSVWAMMIWEMTWELIDNGVSHSGFDPDLYNGTGGNNLAMQLVMDGMKLQPCSPGFVDARDGILAADLANNGGVNQCAIWKAFAKRGLGASASQGSSGSTSDGTEAFDIPSSCDFIGAAPDELSICAGSDAIYNLTIGAAWSPPVTLTATGNPGATTTGFSLNPVPSVPNTSDLTIGNTGAVPFGTYNLNVNGDDTVDTFDLPLVLNVFDQSPGAPSLTLPADNATGVGTSPTLEWSAGTQCDTDYTIEIDDDPAFGSIDYTANETGGTTHTVTASLGPLTTYHWRVRCANPCGAGSNSGTFTFETVNMICQAPGVAIPDNDTNGVSDTITLADSAILTDVDVLIRTTHGWVGDLVVRLEKVGGATIDLLNQPGVPASTFGCDSDDYDAVLDDEGTGGTIEDTCEAGPAAQSPPNFTPDDPLSTFDGVDQMGDWTLTVSDVVSALTGTFDEWCLMPSSEVSSPIFSDGFESGDTTAWSSAQP